MYVTGAFKKNSKERKYLTQLCTFMKNQSDYELGMDIVLEKDLRNNFYNNLVFFKYLVSKQNNVQIFEKKQLLERVLFQFVAKKKVQIF